jgi:hypothetical protein
LLPILAGVLILYAFLLPKILPLFQGGPLAARYFLSALVISPLGLIMGIPFPAGIRLLGEQNPGFVPWAWCANGCASVLGAILPVLIALTWGFRSVWLISALLYLLSLVFVRGLALPAALGRNEPGTPNSPGRSDGG